MLSHVLLSLLLASPPAPAPVETVRTLDLGKMTFEEAKRLEGQAVRVSFIAVASLENGDGTVRTVAKGSAGIARWVYFTTEETLKPRKTIVAEGELRIYAAPPGFFGRDATADTHMIIISGARPVRP
jgi:hypothetical protein